MARVRDPAGYDGQREMILSNAAQLFAQRGYAGTSMNEVAAACGVSKATLYHYVRDKHDLAVRIAEEHVQRLEAVVEEVLREHETPEARLGALIRSFVAEYAMAQNAQRVLTEDVRFLREEDQQRIIGVERRVVAAFARTIADVRGEDPASKLGKPMAMLLFGMINWMFTWMKPGRELDPAAIGEIVADLFFGGVRAVELPPALAAKGERAPAGARKLR
ncbi:TetR/AcrR family transcriptional regulator [Variovorax sp. RA8]|uniref:TetR/AcrR family transcriptional regulator n=1 Tax=Variovorax sp. (strain JCM 16519 / RA8) TaxID=662548 RepID=UPI001316E7B1|nr:TetR/AcrR family transcriptional regulator [Variovorax sp. RA8]VTU32635.1 Fatty acid metabolism regulator protein [Variovorax sp. RA8]